MVYSSTSDILCGETLLVVYVINSGDVETRNFASLQDVGWVERKRKAQATPTRSMSPWDERGTQLLNVGLRLRYTQPTIIITYDTDH